MRPVLRATHREAATLRATNRAPRSRNSSPRGLGREHGRTTQLTCPAATPVSSRDAQGAVRNKPRGRVRCSAWFGLWGAADARRGAPSSSSHAPRSCNSSRRQPRSAEPQLFSSRRVGAARPNDTAQQRRGTGELEVPETNHAPPSAAAPGSQGVQGSPAPTRPGTSGCLCYPRRPASMPVPFLVQRAARLGPVVRLGWGAIFGPLVGDTPLSLVTAV